ncbi:MAG: hypothetical protein DHS20C19_07600 [Acidimicrobiales bacterium]|nr:MAG: hypothetical protein DHS20C19_07600 [Acidimicrobiales bacterium]
MRRWWKGRNGRPDDGTTHALDGAVIGDLDGPTAIVDEKGRIGAVDGSWWLEWGVGAEDRWRVAHDEVAVRQSRVSDAPVYETWLRVPGGDVVQRVAAANDGLGRTLVVEFENASGTAVAVALAGRVAGSAALVADVDAITLDTTEWIRTERSAGAVHATVGEPWGGVTAGAAATRDVVEGVDPSATLIVPLPHRQRVRFDVLVEGDFPTRPSTPEDVAAGWRAVTADALAIEVPDAELGEAWSRIVPDLVVLAGSDDPRSAAEAATVLDIAGLLAEADRARATVAAATEAGTLRGGDAVAAMRAFASRDLLAGEESGLTVFADVLAAAAGDAIDEVTLEQVARALDASAPQAAADARRAATVATAAFEPVTAAAKAAATVLDHVIDVSSTGSIAVLPDVPSSWRGNNIDVRNCGTANGRVSFSVRWHGSRPALLWERHGGSDAIEMRCPGLDSSWSTLERSGEALLAEPLD